MRHIDIYTSMVHKKMYRYWKTKDKIDYEYSMETTKLIADWIASCPVNFVNVIVPENDKVQLTLSRTRKK